VLDEEADGRTEELLTETSRRLARVARARELDATGYFWLAYAQDELGRYYEAVASSREALKRRPRYAPSKYNAAVSLAKLGRYREACSTLEGIAPADEFAGMVVDSATDDADLWDAVPDLYWERRMRGVLRKIRQCLPPKPLPGPGAGNG
jgi:tetratricopeptide (TPR) repeat protein